MFHEYVYIPESDGFQASACAVFTDDEGYFITVETDPHEGSAMFTLPVAVRVHEMLGRAIQAARMHGLRSDRDRTPAQ